MEMTTFFTEIPGFKNTFPCYMRSCKNASEHVIRLKHGSTFIQVSLCDDCFKQVKRFYPSRLRHSAQDGV